MKPSTWNRRAVVMLMCVAAQAWTAFAADPPAATKLDVAAAGRFAALALRCVHQPYPNKISHNLNSDSDVAPPQHLTPAFYGCYDWHSSVHGHWLLAHLLRQFPLSPFATAARAALERSLTQENIAVEVAYLQAEGRASFERPYGLAWLLALSTELRRSHDADAQRWLHNLAPLEQTAVQHLRQWLPKLRYPIRIGEHNQTAFSFGLIWDWAQLADDPAMLELLRNKAAQFYAADQRCPLAYEPSGEDFLSPCLGEADFMRRVLAPAQFAHWLTRFLPDVPRDGSVTWLQVGIVTDRSDPKLAHIDGLNLSRAWMLRGIASALPPRDVRRRALLLTAQQHADASLPAVTGEHYEGGHWLGTFAVYLLTGTGLAGAGP
jgi:hypothetical protein